MRHRRQKHPRAISLEEVERIQATLREEGTRGLEPPPTMQPPPDPTWADLELRARYCPVCAAVVATTGTGILDRETALITAILRLSRQYQELRDAALEVMMAERPRPSGW